MKKSIRQAQSIVGVSPGRPSDDFYPTPRAATEAILDRETFAGGVWECACGDGAISKVLEDYGYYVVSTDLYDRRYGISNIDFLKTKRLKAPNIMTNPPFKLADDFVRHAIHDLKCQKLILLAKLAFLEGQRRTEMLERTPLSHVYVFRKRLTMTRRGEKQRNSGMIAFAWFVWEEYYTGKPRISWI